MNETLKRIRAEANQAIDSRLSEAEERKFAARRRSEAAAPLFRAFKDVRNQFVRIDVMRQIWPNDYHQRDDRASGLVAELIGGEEYPCGLRLFIPGGFRRFQVDLAPDDSISFVASRESAGARPHYMTFTQEEPWLDVFYKTMAHLLEI